MSEKRKNPEQQRNMMILGGIVVAAVLVFIVAAVMSSRSTLTGGAIDYTGVNQTRTDDGAFIIGNPEAPVTIVAFEDFLCPHCQAYEPVIQEFMRQYVLTGKARFEYRMLPAVDPTYSPLAARFAECADTLNPGTFFQAHDLMFELASASRFSNSTPRTFAERLGLKYSDLLECTADADQVTVDTQLATQLGAGGTPTVMVRYGDSRPQVSPFGTQPTLEQLGMLVSSLPE